MLSLLIPTFSKQMKSFRQGGNCGPVRGSIRSVAKLSEEVSVVGFPYPCCSNEPRSKSVSEKMA